MPLRFARLSDLGAINDLCTRAFWDDDLVGRFMHPRRTLYPGDVIKYWRSETRLKYWDWTRKLLVATDEHDNVVGVADWGTKGSLNVELELSWWDPRNVMKIVARCQNYVTSILWPNRAADLSTLDVYDRASPWYVHVWQGQRADGYCLDLLAVAPEHQGRGYGIALVKWGLQRARNDHVCASVIIAQGTDHFYQKCGFEVMVGNSCEGEGNPLNGVKGGNILFMDAPGKT